jgi:hypothetical protein
LTYDGTTLQNTQSTSAAHIAVRSTSTGDPFFSIQGPLNNYYLGQDVSAADDPIILGVGTTPGTTPIFQVSTAGEFIFYRSLDMQENNIKAVVDITMSGQFDGLGSANINNFNEINANTKNFDIEHPIKGNPWRLQYTSLEGPEAGVYLRGKTTDKVIELPDYWTGLVHEDSITVQLTPIGSPCVHYVVKVEDNKVFIDCEDGQPNCYYLIQAKRKDISGPKLEYIKE